MNRYDPFAEVYDELVGDAMTGDIPFYVELALDTEGPLVELAVGTGGRDPGRAPDGPARARDRRLAADARAGA